MAFSLGSCLQLQAGWSSQTCTKNWAWGNKGSISGPPLTHQPSLQRASYTSSTWLLPWGSILHIDRSLRDWLQLTKNSQECSIEMKLQSPLRLETIFPNTVSSTQDSSLYYHYPKSSAQGAKNLAERMYVPDKASPSKPRASPDPTITIFVHKKKKCSYLQSDLLLHFMLTRKIIL